jgi:hypothetical protein
MANGGMKFKRSIVAAAVAAAVLTACGGGGSGGFDITDPIGSVVNLALDGTFADFEGMTVEFDGEQAVITDHGDSIFSTAPSVLPLGSALVDDISCGENSCSGQVAVPTVVNGTLTGFTRETVTVTKDGDTLVLVSASLGEKEYTPYTPPAAGSGNLTQSASCQQWFEALAAVGTWRFTYINSIDFTGAPAEEVKLRFHGTNSYEWTNNLYMGLANATGTFHFDEKIFGTDYCRFYFDDGLSAVAFPKSLSGGVLRMNLSYDSDVRYWELQAE